jgi:hypothetical protein
MSASVMPTASNRRSALRFGLAAALGALTRPPLPTSGRSDVLLVSQLRPDLSHKEIDQLLDGIAAAWIAARREDPLAEGDVA